MTKKQVSLLAGEIEYRNPNMILLQHPSRTVISGASGTGKTYWLMKLLQHKDSPFDRVIWAAPDFSLEQQKMKNFKKNLGRKLVLIKGIDKPKIDKLVDQGFKDGLQQVIVFDDLMSEEDDWMSKLFTSGRHKNCSIIELTQQLFTGKYGRTNRLNTNYFVLFKFNDKSEFKRLAQQISPMHYKELTEAYTKVTDKKNGCLIIDTLYHQIDHPNSKYLKYRDTDLNMSLVELADI